jgi:hypothetical protein
MAFVDQIHLDASKLLIGRSRRHVGGWRGTRFLWCGTAVRARRPGLPRRGLADPAISASNLVTSVTGWPPLTVAANGGIAHRLPEAPLAPRTPGSLVAIPIEPPQRSHAGRDLDQTVQPKPDQGDAAGHHAGSDRNQSFQAVKVQGDGPISTSCGTL